MSDPALQIQVRECPVIEQLALRVALRLDEVVSARTQAFPVEPAELEAALERLRSVRCKARSAIAQLATALRQRETDQVGRAFLELHDLGKLERFGALVQDGAERLACDIECAAAMRRFAARFTPDTHAPYHPVAPDVAERVLAGLFGGGAI